MYSFMILIINSGSIGNKPESKVNNENKYHLDNVSFSMILFWNEATVSITNTLILIVGKSPNTGPYGNTYQCHSRG